MHYDIMILCNYQTYSNYKFLIPTRNGVQSSKKCRQIRMNENKCRMFQIISNAKTPFLSLAFSLLVLSLLNESSALLYPTPFFVEKYQFFKV